VELDWNETVTRRTAVKLGVTAAAVTLTTAGTAAAAGGTLGAAASARSRISGSPHTWQRSSYARLLGQRFSVAGSSRGLRLTGVKDCPTARREREGLPADLPRPHGTAFAAHDIPSCTTERSERCRCSSRRAPVPAPGSRSSPWSTDCMADLATLTIESFSGRVGEPFRLAAGDGEVEIVLAEAQSLGPPPAPEVRAPFSLVFAARRNRSSRREPTAWSTLLCRAGAVRRPAGAGRGRSALPGDLQLMSGGRHSKARRTSSSSRSANPSRW